MFYVLGFIFVAILFFFMNPVFGGKSQGRELKRMRKSRQYENGKFRNFKKLSVSTRQPDEGFFSALHTFLFKDRKLRSPQKALPSMQINKGKYNKSSDDVILTWLGHSTVLIRTAQQTIITDPIFSKRASFFKCLGPKRFKSKLEYSVSDLPQIDIVLISHDHYDHLDYYTIKKLKDCVKKFYVPLGVKAHLLKWGVESKKIVALDWYEELFW